MLQLSTSGYSYSGSLINKGALYNISQLYVVLLCQLWFLLLTVNEFFSILEIHCEDIVSILRTYDDLTYFMNSVNTHVTGTFGVYLSDEIPFLYFSFDGNASGHACC